MDRVDAKILEILQEDASLSMDEIAERVGLSSTPCWRRIKALEVEGVIRKRVALVDPEKLNLSITVFVSVRTNQHNFDWLAHFSRSITTIPEVIEVYRMSGDVDYLLRIVVPDVAGYDAIYKRLIAIGGLTDVSSSFAMERIKSVTALPTNHVPLRPSKVAPSATRSGPRVRSSAEPPD